MNVLSKLSQNKLFTLWKKVLPLKLPKSNHSKLIEKKFSFALAIEA